MEILLLDRPFPEQRLAEAAKLDLRNIGPSVWPKIVSRCRASHLRLYHLTLSSLGGLGALTHTHHLELEWATKVEELSPVFRLGSRLSSLSVFDFPKLRDLAGIEALTELTELNLSGSRSSLTPPLRLASLEPIARLGKLATLSLANARLDDDDITVLARCKSLRRLQLSNQFDRAQVAFLAKRLNPQLDEPLTAFRQTHLPCKTCGTHQCMITGRRMPILCPVCDQAKFAGLASEFESAADPG